MTISSSLNAGVSGLSANATRLGTISDNIANSSTIGYRRVETDFNSMVMGSNGGGYSAGGVRAETQRLISEGGSVISTANATDIAIRGNGFIPVAQKSEIEAGVANPQMLLTTTGSFRPDDQGFLRTGSGMVLMGWPAAADGTVPIFSRDSSDGLEPIKLQLNQLISDPTTELSFGINLPATDAQPGATPGAPIPLSVEYYDALGNSQALSTTFTSQAPAEPNVWRMAIEDPGGTVVGDYDLTFDNTPGAGGALIDVFDNVAGAAASSPVSLTIIDPTSAGAGGPGDQVLTIDLMGSGSSSGLTQLGDTFAPLDIQRDGSEAASMVSVEIDENGFVTGLFENGSTRLIYQVPLADVPNANGLMAMDNQVYQTTPNSGRFMLWNAGSGPTGTIVPFALEESATDVAGELTDMIQTQRAYSSNAKVIQTVDEMLQETTNMKR